MKQWVNGTLQRGKRQWRRLALFTGLGLAGLIIIGQCIYPSDHLVPFTTIDTVKLGGWQRQDAVTRLDKAYAATTIPVYFGNVTKPYRSPHPADIGLVVQNKSRLQTLNYPWYLRIIPTSILWAHIVIHQPAPAYARSSTTLATYITKELGGTCHVEPENASLIANGAHLTVVPSHPGGTCDEAVVKKELLAVTPQLSGSNRVTIPVTEIAASVSDSMAKSLGERLTKKIGNGVTITAGSHSYQFTSKDVLSWLDFQVTDGQLTYNFNADRASATLTKALGSAVAVPAGTTTVSTYDFVETGRTVGPSGQQLDVADTLTNLKAYIEGESDSVAAATSEVPPTVVYNRSYSPTDQGLSALMQHYAESHSGTYGVSLIELSGQRRHAGYNDTNSFTTASTYKLFVAYSTLKRVEVGSWHWSDQINGGRDLSTCFDDMIEKSDNACAEALLAKVGYKQITDDAHSLGCMDTSFMGNDGIKSTPADEALFLSELATNQMLSQQSSRDRFVNALKNNIYRQGIPTGVPNATVADKVGFLWALLHDAAIVYSPTGTYVLVIMTDGSSWGNIAELAGQIEALRTQ